MSLADIAETAGIPIEAVDITAKWEGCLKKVKGEDLYVPYYCPAHVATIGIGTTQYNDRGGIAVRISDPGIPRAECERLLAYDLGKKYAPAVRRAVKPGAFKTMNQYSACISFAYNCGTAGFTKSTLCWLINNGQHERAAQEFNKWVRGGGRVLPGLVNRRRDESALFARPGLAYSNPNSTSVPPVAPTPTPIAPTPTPVVKSSWWRSFWPFR